MKILVVEDNPLLRENLAFLLKKFHYIGETAANGHQALDKISLSHYDAIVLDINMPVMGGKEFLTLLRSRGKNTPVIALTSNGMLEDKLEMFDLGVDDYMTKPFEIEELIARLKSLLKRTDKKIDELISIGEITINRSNCKVYLENKEVAFAYKQYLIIEFLALNKGYPQSKTKIMEYVWGEQEENLEFDSTTLESHIYAIRKKVGKNFIKTIKGIGYIIEE